MVRYFVKIERFGDYSKISEAPSKNPEDIRDLVNSLDNVYRFSFYEKDLIIVKGREVIGDEKKNFSNYYYVGTRLTLAEVENRFPEASDIIERMTEGKSDAVLTPCGKLVVMVRNAEVFTP